MKTGGARCAAAPNTLTGSPKSSWGTTFVRYPGWTSECLETVLEVIDIFRVSQTKDRFGTVVNIDGQLVGDYVRVAMDYCSQALASGTPVSLFLRDVSAIDEAGRKLLRSLAERGVRLLASGVYTSHLVKGLQRASHAQRPAGSASWSRTPGL